MCKPTIIIRKYKSPVNKTMATIDKADTSFAHSKPNPADIDMTKVSIWAIKANQTINSN